MTKIPIKKLNKEAREHICQLSYLKMNFADLEMYKTFHKLDEALNQAGWELAEKLEEKRTKNEK